jgi:CRP-like cAMP-binding protein
MEPSVVYVIHRAELRRLIMMRPQVAEAVVQTLASALRHLVVLVEDLSLRHVTARVAKMLLEQEASTQEEQHIYHLTQQEMAALAGTAREVVGRALKELEAASISAYSPQVSEESLFIWLHSPGQFELTSRGGIGQSVAETFSPTSRCG